MAYYRRTKRSGYAGRRYRRSTVGYSRYKKSARVKSAYPKRTRTKVFPGKGKAMGQRLEALEKQSLGEATSIAFDPVTGASVSFYSAGDRRGQNYWEVPISSMLQCYMTQQRVSKLHLTGVAVEGDVYANADIELFAMNIIKALGSPSQVALVPEEKRYGLGYGNVDGPFFLGRVKDERVRELASVAFEAPSRDGTLFGARLHSDKSSRSTVCESRVDGGKINLAKNGRSAFDVTIRPVGTSMASSVQKKSVRWYWPLSQTVKVLSVGKTGLVEIDYSSVLLMGVRPKTELAVPDLKVEQGGGGGGGAAGSLNCFRVTLTFRQKVL
ncbi:hypothetical protein CABS01_16930 [Colletotrichum abscissum]|uniref:Uncharacterized protein n=1 Tax=Colletotrichum abscissum TaxID=1671311 RepID=A0A9Q0AW48_9PEZI|nr:uncharacterized protein CABS01_16930 [Colletotrichum abscissum]KAI3530648.1 hypothetical protein CABS02_14451 [Colletotrichum abscissum]KAK1504287.1 hypothetical protein CABS01_16930 [Colletotrichum abscissum]